LAPSLIQAETLRRAINANPNVNGGQHRPVTSTTPPNVENVVMRDGTDKVKYKTLAEIMDEELGVAILD